MEEKSDKKVDVKVGRSFKLTRKLGSGAFGEIFHGINLKTNMEVAIKVHFLFHLYFSKEIFVNI